MNYSLDYTCEYIYEYMSKLLMLSSKWKKTKYPLVDEYMNNNFKEMKSKASI